ncbi:hypothetical protein HZH66_001298 [Vespula vulgaris]|uniref:Uncharacterized protein n=1 Tax=Vespula vulgaris TaxID=7454 RepID=A0A834KT25_VESVU|nr:hypothetical protein HZH66_001298 [Vespula vulgaris]
MVCIRRLSQRHVEMRVGGVSEDGLRVDVQQDAVGKGGDGDNRTPITWIQRTRTFTAPPILQKDVEENAEEVDEEVDEKANVVVEENCERIERVSRLPLVPCPLPLQHLPLRALDDCEKDVFVLDLVDRNHSQNVANVVEIHAGVSNRNITFSTFTGNNLLYVVIDRTFVETVSVSYDSDDSIFVLSTRELSLVVRYKLTLCAYPIPHSDRNNEISLQDNTDMYVRPDSVSAHQIAYCFYSIRKFCSAILACHGNDKSKHEWSIFTEILECQKEY